MLTVTNIALVILIVGCTTVVSKYIDDEAQKIYDGNCFFSALRCTVVTRELN